MAHVDVFAAAAYGFVHFVLGVLQGDLHQRVGVVVFEQALFLVVEVEVVNAGGVAFGVVAVFGQRFFDEFVGAAVLFFGFVFVDLPVKRGEVEVVRQGVFALDFAVVLVFLRKGKNVGKGGSVNPAAFAVQEVAIVDEVAAVVERFVGPEGAAVGKGGVVQRVFVVDDVRVVKAQDKEGFFDALPDGGVFAAAVELGADFACLFVREDAWRGKGQVRCFRIVMDKAVKGIFDLCRARDAAFAVKDIHRPAAPFVEDVDVAGGAVVFVEKVLVALRHGAAAGTEQDAPLFAARVATACYLAAQVVAVYSCKGMDEMGDALQPALRRFPFDFHGLVAGKRQATPVGKAQVAPVVDEPGIGGGQCSALFEQALQFGGFEVAEVGEGFFAVVVGLVVHQWA